MILLRAILLCWALVALNPLRAATPPNIVVILADDQGWGDLSVSGNTNLSTPAIDSLAAHGATLERFYVSPVCSPTRAEFLTGRYHVRGGVRGVTTGGERLGLDERTLAQELKKAGYATGAFGKWHNGTQYPYHPNGRGFDEFYGFCSGHWGTYFDPPLEHNGKPVKGSGYITDDLTTRAIDFMVSNRVRPFFCYLPLNTPHSPMQVPDFYYDKFRDKELGMRSDGRGRPENVEFTRAALAMCENIDRNVARVLKALDQLQLAENTIVIYFSDNGPNGPRWNGGMRGVKGSVDEGGVRVPFFIRWPGKIPSGLRVKEIAGAIDLLPTVTALAGIEYKPGRSLDGLNLSPLLLGISADWPDRLIYSHWNNKVSVRSQHYRLDSENRLYDMLSDPGQERNVADMFAEEHRRLVDAAAIWRRTVLAEMDRSERPFTVGYREFPRTELPARDGVPHGSIRRSAQAPNCSFFTNWTNANDSITWDVEVANSGNYNMELFYTCAPGNAGVVLETSSGKHSLSSRITRPHDPPLRGQEHDRVPRSGESYVKDFATWQMGQMKLEKGRSPLMLKVRDMPGEGAVDLRGIVLTLAD